MLNLQNVTKVMKCRCLIYRMLRQKQQKVTLYIDCMMFVAVISVISWQPVHLFMLSWGLFNQYTKQYSFQATGCFPI